MSKHFHSQGLAVFGRMWISVMCWLVLRYQPVLAAEGDWGVTYGQEVVTWPGGTVVLPCSFWFPDSNGSGVRRAFWKKSYATSREEVYSFSSQVNSDYKNRVSLIGDLNEKNCSLRIINVRRDDGSTYYFRFEAKQAFTGSGGIKLTVKYPYRPHNIKVTFDPDKVAEGMNVTLKCKTDSWPPAHNFTWMREFQNGHKESLTKYGENITIPQVQLEDSGWYYCTAINTQGRGDSYTHLEVLCGGGVESSVSYGAKVLHVVKGAQAMLPCSFCYYRFTKSSRVEGYWLLNNARDFTKTVYPTIGDYQPDSNYLGRVSLAGDLAERNCSLLIKDVRLSDANKYYFFTYVDRAPLFAEMGVELKVTVLPDSVHAQQDVPALVTGEPASLSCSVTNVYPSDSINITWCQDVIAGVVTTIETALPDGTFNITSSLNFTPSADHYGKTCACSVQGVNVPLTLQAPIKLHHKEKDSIVRPVVLGVVALVVLFSLLILLVILRRWKRAKQSQPDEYLNPELMSVVQPMPDSDDSVDAKPQGMDQEASGTGYGTPTMVSEDDAVYCNVDIKPRKVNKMASNAQELDREHPSVHAVNIAKCSVHRTVPQKPPRTLANEDSTTYSKVSFMRKEGPRTASKNPRQEDEMAECCGPADDPDQDPNPSTHDDGAGSGFGRDADEDESVGDVDSGEGIDNEGDIVYAKLSFAPSPAKN